MNTISKDIRKTGTRVFSYICAAFALAMIVTQFLPFWGCYGCKNCAEGALISVNQYVWFANDHKYGLTDVLSNYYIPGFRAMDVVAICAFMQLASVFTILFAALRPQRLLATSFCLVAGIIGVVGYLTSPAYQLGQLWIVHLIIAACGLLAALGSMAWSFAHAYKKAKAELKAAQEK